MNLQATTPRERTSEPHICCLNSVCNRTAIWTDGPTAGTSTVTCAVCGYSWTEQVATVYDKLSPIDPRD